MRIQLNLVLLALAACGGNLETGPLRHTFDESTIAQVPASQQRTVLAAEARVNRAQLAMNGAEADLRDARLALEMARNRHEQAKLETRACGSQLDAARKSHQQARIEEQRECLEQARRAEAAAAAHIEFEKANVAFEEQQFRAARAAWYAAGARRELAEARVAAAHGIVPPGAEMSAYESQLQRRLDILRLEREQAAELRQQALSRRAEWSRLEQVAYGEAAPRR